MAAGSISAEEFTTLALQLADFSLAIDDSWRVGQSPQNPEVIYLEKTALVPERSGTPTQEDKEDYVEDSDLEDDHEDDPSCKQVPQTNSYLTYKFHVLYSHSYSVPVLYFNVFRPDGLLLKLEELWSRVPADYQARMQDHKWATLTQQEHPLLGRPFFMLHPCHTATLMSQVPHAQDKRYYLIKWLSSVGPVVGLEMSPAYATAFDRRETT